jgi:hypothetical protein
LATINRSLSKQSLSIISGISHPLSSPPCGSPSGSHGSGGSSSNRRTDSSGSYHAVPAWISYEGNYTSEFSEISLLDSYLVVNLSSSKINDHRQFEN